MKIKLQYRYWIVIMALVTVVLSILFTNFFTRQIAFEERQKMEIWAEATRRLLNDEYNDFIFRIIENNEHIPVIIADDRDHYISSRNIKIPDHDTDLFFERKIRKFKEQNEPIEIVVDGMVSQYIYYGNSTVLTQLSYYPYVQMFMIAVFLVFLIWAFSSDKQNEQNQVWIGLSKETAHQLGTPITSLMAWNEILRARYAPDGTFDEVDKDIGRLRMIAERFSKIGSVPNLVPADMADVTRKAMEYMQLRTSKKIVYSFDDTSVDSMALLCEPLYAWVIENLCRNAIDAMDGAGNIDFELKNEASMVVIEISDSGKGIERRKYKTVFRPGYTTKQRGWGLGLSFAKRIITDYHHGRIFVKSSEIGLGTTFRIEIPLCHDIRKP